LAAVNAGFINMENGGSVTYIRRAAIGIRGESCIGYLNN